MNKNHDEIRFFKKSNWKVVFSFLNLFKKPKTMLFQSSIGYKLHPRHKSFEALSRVVLNPTCV